MGSNDAQASNNFQTCIDDLFTAELQFRLASAVRLAVTAEEQPLEVPLRWIHGKHSVIYEEMALPQDQADFAAAVLHRSCTYLMAVAIKDAIRVAVPDPKNSIDPNVQAAYQISRLIRNAFAHSPFAPTWSIDQDCRDRVLMVHGVIRLDTTGLNGTPFDWRHYGGPLAVFELSRFVRASVLGDKRAARKLIPKPRKAMYQQGDMILTRVSEIPADVGTVAEARRTNGGIDLGGGYSIQDVPEGVE